MAGEVGVLVGKENGTKYYYARTGQQHKHTHACSGRARRHTPTNQHTRAAGQSGHAILAMPSKTEFPFESLHFHLALPIHSSTEMVHLEPCTNHSIVPASVAGCLVEKCRGS